MVAALYVDGRGCYANLPGVDVWDIERDARLYVGPHPVVAHPPCQRWGRFSEGGPSAPGTRKTGDDAGRFAAALASLRAWGGVLEHPKDSKAWAAFGLMKPSPRGGWLRSGESEWTCCVEQGHYGHFSRKATWLYVVGPRPPELTWGRAPNTLPPTMVERYGYAKARRIGVMAMVGGSVTSCSPSPVGAIRRICSCARQEHNALSLHAARCGEGEAHVQGHRQ